MLVVWRCWLWNINLILFWSLTLIREEESKSNCCYYFNRPFFVFSPIHCDVLGYILKYSCFDLSLLSTSDILRYMFCPAERLRYTTCRLRGCSHITSAAGGGGGGTANADYCWRRGEGGSAKCWQLLTRGGGGVTQKLTIADEVGLGLKFSFTNEFWTTKNMGKRNNICKLGLTMYSQDKTYVQNTPQSI